MEDTKPASTSTTSTQKKERNIMVATINPTAINRALQMELDLEIDRARLERIDWQRALERNLHALQDYVHDDLLLIYQPGVLKIGRGDSGFRAFDVQLTTTTSCTCSRFKLRDRCEHIAFAKMLEAHGLHPNTDSAIRATDLETDLGEVA